ncbi:MAG: hypothetical protein V1746_07300 [bacterium]
MSDKERKALDCIILDAFGNHYHEKEIIELGQRVVDQDFKKMPPHKRNALGEVLAVARHAEVPLPHLTDLIIHHLKLDPRSDEANVMHAIADMAAQDTAHPFHNSRHVGDTLISLMALWHANELPLERLPAHVMKMLGHDLRHPGLTNQHSSFAQRTGGKEYIERDSLKVLGLAEENGKVVILENSVFNGIRDEKRRQEIVETVWQGVLDTEPTNAGNVRREFLGVWNAWADGRGSEERFNRWLERVVALRADILPSQTYYGSKSLAHTLCEEWKKALDRESGLTEEQRASKLSEIEKIISPKGQATFINSNGPCTPGEFKMGLFHEKIWLVNKFLYDRDFAPQLGFERPSFPDRTARDGFDAGIPRGRLVVLEAFCATS